MKTLALPKDSTDTVRDKRPECDKISKFAKNRNLLKNNKSVSKTPSPANKNKPHTPKPIDITEEDPALEADGWPKSLPQKLSMVLAMAWHDKYLKEAFIEDPVEIARLLGIDMPEGVILRAEDVRGTCCVTIMEYNAEMGIHRRGMSLKLNLVAEM